MAAKKGPSFSMSNDHRVKIQNSNILNALIEHATGKRDMSATQVSAGLGLLKKIMPDLAATTISGDLDVNADVTHHESVPVSESAAFVAAALRAREIATPPKSRQN